MKNGSRAYCLIREQPHYRRDAFVTGLARAGYDVVTQPPAGRQGPGDLLIVWNRYGSYHQAALAHERAGGLVLVAENGYLGRDRQGVQMYALACHGHNGSGWWPEGDGSRFAALGVEPRPWRAGGGYLYVRGQRGIGSPEMASPPAWHRGMAERLTRSGHVVICEDHPGVPANDPGEVERLHERLAGASACVIWSSAMGVRALVEGVPVFYCAPHWICSGAARRGTELLDEPIKDDAARLRALERMAWAQWSIAELQSGEPFKRLVECEFRQRGAEEAVT